MTYREFLNTLSDEDFAEIIAQDGIFNAACVDNFDFNEERCPNGYTKCKECVLELLKSESI
jgi:hypothetical protein